MTFTVVRAVRGPEPASTESTATRQRLAKTAAPLVSTARMDLPRIDGVLKLDFGGSDFPETIPDPLG